MTDIVERLRRGATSGVLIPCEDLIQAAEIIEQYRADAAYDECTINFLKAGSAAQAGQVTPEMVAAVKAAACGGCGAYPYEDCKRGVPGSCFRLHHGGGYLVPSADRRSPRFPDAISPEPPENAQ